MDKYEYKHLADQIQYLIDQKEYAEAAEIADKIDWRRVRSVMMLGTISDLYRINHRYEDARDIMLMAYDRKPENRQVCYSLCELFIKTGEMANAVEFYKEYAQLAPKDPGQYILQYKMYEANGVSLEERAEVLENLKKHEYQEKWMYELAYLYHRMELPTKCVEVCDELVLWFGSGKYVNKALELKMLHEPLTPKQQQIYDNRFQPEEPVYDQEDAAAEEENDREQPYSGEQSYSGQDCCPDREQPYGEETPAMEELPPEQQAGGTRSFDVEEVRRQMREQENRDAEPDIQVKTVDVGQYNTMNLQAELAAGLKAVLGTEEPGQGNGSHDSMMINPQTGYYDIPVSENDTQAPESEAMEGSEVYFGETGKIRQYEDEGGTGEIYTEDTGEVCGESYDREGHRAAENPEEYEEADNRAAEYAGDFTAEGFRAAEPEETVRGGGSIADLVMEQMRRESIAAQEKLEKEAMTAQPPEPMAKVLTQESDGQISLVVPENKKLEKQITGQISIEDIRAEWERMKQESREKQEEEVRQQVIRQTGKMFTEFEEALRDNILREMEKKEDPSLYKLPEDTGTTDEEEENGQSPDWVMEGIAYEEQEEPAEQLAENDGLEFTFEDIAEEEAETDHESVLPREQLSETLQEEETDAQGPVEAVETEEAAEADEAGAAETDEIQAAGETQAGEAQAEEEVQAEADEARITEGETEAVVAVETEEVTGEDGAREAGEAQAEEETEPGEDRAEKEAPEASEPQAADREAEESTEQPLYDHGAAGQKAQEPWEAEYREPADPWDDNEEPEDLREEGKAAEPAVKTAKEKVASNVASEPAVRPLTEEEQELFGDLIQGRGAREQLVRALDNISMAAYTGNVIITGEEGKNTLALAKNIVREVKLSDSNFSGVAAKTNGKTLSKKDIAEFVEQIKNGALIVDQASMISDEAVENLYKCLQQDSYGIIVVLIDSKKNMNSFLKKHRKFAGLFTARVDMAPLSNDALAGFAQEYAREQEFSIDDLGMLALHTRIDEMQTAQHSVTRAEVQELMDMAIESASRKTLGHFFDILFGRRYDDEDMIIISEKDFM